jgi:hypothetical protein
MAARFSAKAGSLSPCRSLLPESSSCCVSKCSAAPGVRLFAFDRDHLGLIYRDVEHGAACCGSSVADHEARCLVLIVVCARIQWCFAAKKRGKFCAVGNRCQEGRHGCRVFKTRGRNENLEIISHGIAVYRLNAENAAFHSGGVSRQFTGPAATRNQSPRLEGRWSGSGRSLSPLHGFGSRLTH